MRVTFDKDGHMEPEDPALTEQPSLFSGMFPETILEQGQLFPLGQPERKPATKGDDTATGELF